MFISFKVGRGMVNFSSLYSGTWRGTNRKFFDLKDDAFQALTENFFMLRFLVHTLC